jgi:hypothetical protein
MMAKVRRRRTSCSMREAESFIGGAYRGQQKAAHAGEAVIIRRRGTLDQC